MKIDLNFYQTIISIIKDIITGFSALAAAIIAAKGLQAWKKQLKGKTEYELAQRLLRAVYDARNALACVRNPFQSSAEIFQAMKEANIEGDPSRDPQIRIRKEEALYARRWRKIQETFTDLESILLEAETLWGDVIRDLFKPLQQCASVLHTNVQMHLSNLERPKRYDEAEERRRTSILYSITDKSADDAFSAEISTAISGFENFLKPRLKF